MTAGQTVSRPRMEWLDAMRGFTMILVVAYHVAQMCYGENEKTSASLPFLVLFRMPLFFFVSGFLAYRSRFEWTWEGTGKLAWKKFKIQVFPAIVFLCVCLVLRSGAFWPALVGALHSPTKSGYWFTWVLLLMFLVYYALEMSVRHLSARGRSWAFVAAFVVSLAVYETCYMPRWFIYPRSAWMNTTSLVQVCRFMPYFLLGNLAHRHWERAGRLFDALWFYPLLVAVAFVSTADIFRWHTMRFMWTNLPRTLAVYSLLLIVVAFFRHYASWFSKTNAVGRTLQYIGTRTLDVYLLHFILMPSVPWVGEWLNAHQPNFLLDVLACVAMALPVIGLCLLVSNILRVSPIYSEYFFGRKP